MFRICRTLFRTQPDGGSEAGPLRLLLGVPSSSGRGLGLSCFAMASAQVLRSGLSARLKLSDSDKSDSRAARGPESAATPPAPPHAGGSAGDTADSGAADMLQSLPHLEEGRKHLTSHRNVGMLDLFGVFSYL